MKEEFIFAAYKESLKAYNRNEVPIGAVLVKDGKIIAKGYNKKITNRNPMAHAEINCILKATKKFKTWRLDNCELYVTMEPCEMCRQIIAEARIKKVYFFTERLKFKNNYKQTKYLLIENKIICNKYKKILKDFFAKLR